MDPLLSLIEVTRWIYPDITPMALHKWMRADAFRPEIYAKASTGPGKGNMLSVSDLVVVGILRNLFAWGLGTKDLSNVPGPVFWTTEMSDQERSEIDGSGERKLQRYLELLSYAATVYYESFSIAGPFAGWFWGLDGGHSSKLLPSFIVFPKKSDKAQDLFKERRAATYCLIDVSQWHDYVVSKLRSAGLMD